MKMKFIYGILLAAVFFVSGAVMAASSFEFGYVSDYNDHQSAVSQSPGTPAAKSPGFAWRIMKPVKRPAEANETVCYSYNTRSEKSIYLAVPTKIPI